MCLLILRLEPEDCKSKDEPAVKSKRALVTGAFAKPATPASMPLSWSYKV